MDTELCDTTKAMTSYHDYVSRCRRKDATVFVKLFVNTDVNRKVNVNTNMNVNMTWQLPASVLRPQSPSLPISHYVGLSAATSANATLNVFESI